MSEEISSQTLPQKTRMNPQDFRNQDLVSRLLAATPPYLYSAPMAPHNFFFSEMLRSLVQAKNNEANSRLQQATANHIPQSHHPHHHVGRRPRKRSWSHHRIPFEHQLVTPAKEFEEKVEKPLELTTKMNSSFEGKSSKREDSPTEKIPRFEEAESRNSAEKIDASSPTPVDQSPATISSPTDLVLPPPPPVWYPSLYPPYGIDPLHFFIDLRVSGHIRSKENSSPSSSGFRPDNNNSQFFDLESKNRHGSAFSIPTPREGAMKSPGAVNLSATASEIDDKDSLSKNTNYVMQNLPRIYTHLNTHHKHGDDQDGQRQDSGGEGDISGSESDLKRPSDEDVIAVDDNDN